MFVPWAAFSFVLWKWCPEPHGKEGKPCSLCRKKRELHVEGFSLLAVWKKEQLRHRKDTAPTAQQLRMY
jgi:hypothetical protein